MVQGVAKERIACRPAADLRYRGVDSVLTVPQPADGDWRSAFEADHQRLFGFVRPEHPLELVNARVEVVGSTEKPEAQPAAETERLLGADEAAATVEAWFPRVSEDGQRGLDRVSTPVYERSALSAGDQVQGPALSAERS